jgi:hypothetical protein
MMSKFGSKIYVKNGVKKLSKIGFIIHYPGSTFQENLLLTNFNANHFLKNIY